MILNIINLIYMLLLNSMYVITSVLSFGALQKYARRLKSVSTDYLLTSVGAPPITLVVPAYNEQESCVEAVRALLDLRYPHYEILVVNDGSTDETLNALINAYDLVIAYRTPISNLNTKPVNAVYQSSQHANLWVIDKANGGKADALNAGLNLCLTPLFCAIDADSLLEQDALLRVVRPFLENSATMAVGGIIRIANGCQIAQGRIQQVRLPKSWIARFQVLEYLRSFLSGRMGWGVLEGIMIVSGAFGLFKRSLVVEIGGYSNDTVGEDMELVVRLHRHCQEKQEPYHIAFIPDPVAWTECPENLAMLSHQRNRWQRGLVESLWRHKQMFLNVRYGKIGMLAFPYYFFLELMGPLIEFSGYICLILALITGIISGPFLLAFFLVAFVYGSIVSIFAIALEELTFRRYVHLKDLVSLLLASMLENIGYRQLLTFWRVQGMFHKLFHKDLHWGPMRHKGFKKIHVSQ